MKRLKLTVIYSPNYLKYNLGPDHPLWPGRTTVFLEKLKKTELSYRILNPTKATDEEILLVHDREYLERVKDLARERGGLSIDTPLNPEILEAAYYSVAGSIMALKEALNGNRAINLLGGLHHAGISDSSGFCIFNDHAIAIRKLQKKRIKKALVLDLDVHAGQGTQEIFYADRSVFTISIHQDPKTLYPGTGFAHQTGAGAGEGYNLNLPLSPGTSEKEYLQTLDSVLPMIRKFKPEVIIVVLGVDTYKDDPLADFRLEETSYQKIGQRLKQFPKLAIMCAGGYSRKTPDLWLSFLKGFCAHDVPTILDRGAVWEK